jgi:hypothetical protein
MRDRVALRDGPNGTGIQTDIRMARHNAREIQVMRFMTIGSPFHAAAET